jgi:hypothetical protein
VFTVSLGIETAQHCFGFVSANTSQSTLSSTLAGNWESENIMIYRSLGELMRINRWKLKVAKNNETTAYVKTLRKIGNSYAEA